MRTARRRQGVLVAAIALAACERSREPADVELEYASAVWRSEELLALGACACTTAHCSHVWRGYIASWRDELAANEMSIAIARPARAASARDLQVACWADAIDRARSASEVCFAMPHAYRASDPCSARAPGFATTDRWWSGADPCAAGELELGGVNGPVPLRMARCITDDNLDRGRFTTWHPGGSVFTDGRFDRDGRKDGTWTVYYPHGRRASRASYVHGALVGHVERWTIAGVPQLAR